MRNATLPAQVLRIQNSFKLLRSHIAQEFFDRNKRGSLRQRYEPVPFEFIEKHLLQSKDFFQSALIVLVQSRGHLVGDLQDHSFLIGAWHENHGIRTTIR